MSVVAVPILVLLLLLAVIVLNLYKLRIRMRKREIEYMLYRIEMDNFYRSIENPGNSLSYTKQKGYLNNI